MLSRLTELGPLVSNCALAITMEPDVPASTVDSEDWYRIWEYVVAVQGMCVRHGHEGNVVGAGQYLFSLL